MNKRMMDIDYKQALSIMGHGRLPEQWQCRLADEIQTRDMAQIAEIERLKTELARLTPSGQVAELLECATRVLVDGDMDGTPEERAEAVEAAQALATKAQGYGAAVTERDEARSALDVFACDARTAKKAAAEWAARFSVTTTERDAAMADFAAIEEVLSPSMVIGFLAVHPPHTREHLRGLTFSWEALEKIAALYKQPHPGSALLKERQEQAETIEALADAFWDTGTSEDGDWHTDLCWTESNGEGPCTAICTERRAALRLAGRLP